MWLIYGYAVADLFMELMDGINNSEFVPAVQVLYWCIGTRDDRFLS